ncbi:MAG: cupin domain-containing protein [Alteraurantiacibacter sp.]
MTAHRLSDNPVHLGLGARAEVEPEFDGMDWYADYEKRHAADGMEGRLVSCHRFTESWDIWEMHPNGAEVVLCTEGAMVLVQEINGQEVHTRIEAGEYAINPPGTWHTADVESEAAAVFITSGIGTEHRPR